MNKEEKLIKLSHILGYQFQDLAMLEQALTHKSVSRQHNERLEFLGDSIVNFMIAEVIYHARELASEGELSRLRASLVKGETLADIAKELTLSDYLFLGVGELRSGGHQRRSILADTLEAIIGAIYLDSDMVTCQKVVLSWFQSRLENLSEYKQKDPKSRLQERLQSKGLPLPAYIMQKIEGEPHEQTFTIQCDVSSLGLFTEAQASSRRKAEQAAAEAMLALIQNKKGKQK